MSELVISQLGEKRHAVERNCHLSPTQHIIEYTLGIKLSPQVRVPNVDG